MQADTTTHSFLPACSCISQLKAPPCMHVNPRPPGCLRRYGWGRNAPVLNLPQGVGFSVGPGSTIRYIVAQVHYLEQRPPGDHSGVRLK